VARPFFTSHPVASNGYTVSSRRAKLRPEYAGLDGRAIAALRAGGAQVSDVVETPLVAFTGDTGADWLAHPSAADALRAKLLICECTFVDEAVTIAQARQYGHTHLDELIAQADKLAGVEQILLIHFSARYRKADILDALERKLPASLKGRVTPLLEGYA
jgi:ribonuclease Z